MLTAISTIYYILKSLFFFCHISLRNIRNISPPYKYCITKFIYVVILSVFVETAFSRYFENYFSYSLEIWQHQFSQVEEAISKKSALGFYLFKEMRELIFVWKSMWRICCAFLSCHIRVYSESTLKETRNSFFCITPKYHPLMFVSWK